MMYLRNKYYIGDLIMIHLTENEKIILKAGCDSEYESICCEYGRDWVFATIENSKLNSKVARGVISSLIKKGLVEVFDNEGFNNSNDMVLIATPEGKNLCIKLGYEKNWI